MQPLGAGTLVSSVFNSQARSAHQALVLSAVLREPTTVEVTRVVKLRGFILPVFCRQTMPSTISR